MTDVDVLVVGAGVAGLSAALGLAGARSVLVVDPGPGHEGSTPWAQGGIASAVGAGDSPGEHAADTVEVGAQLCDPRAVACLVEEGPLRLAELITAGAVFDRRGERLSLTREGGHHRDRVVHAGGDATGAEVARALEAAASRAGITRRRDTTVTGLLVEDGVGRRVVGAELHTADGTETVRARAVVLATGGMGHAYPASTNPAGVTGDGLALALLAGASLADLEFVQFHPTVLHTGARAGQLPLVSEALRGEGAVLLDHRQRPFMAGVHPLADLAPRDVVARRVHAEMIASGRDHVWLDARALPDFAQRFPTVFAAAAGIGVDPRRDLLPVAPAEHFLCGGVVTDRWGATDVPGLFAVGEVADTGVHGANRLASNSLLEGLTFGRRVAARLVLDLPASLAPGAITRIARPSAPSRAADAAREVLGRHAGVVRDASGLRDGLAELDRLRSPESGWLVARAVLAAAAERRETRGCHTRSDHPNRADWWQRRITVRLDGDGIPTAQVDDIEVPAA